MSDLNAIIDNIITNPLFLQLKNVVENYYGFHDNEPVYDHSIKSMETATDLLLGNFIVNNEAKTSYLEWINKEIDGIKKKDILVLTALLHDCGKLLHYKEGDKRETLLVKNTITGQTGCPGHEYWGGAIVVKELLSNSGLPETVKDQIATVVKQHWVFNEYFGNKQEIKASELMSDIKNKAEGYYKECLFNSYADCYSAEGFTNQRKKIEEVFNEPSLYIVRTYFIPHD